MINHELELYVSIIKGSHQVFTQKQSLSVNCKWRHSPMSWKRKATENGVCVWLHGNIGINRAPISSDPTVWQKLSYAPFHFCFVPFNLNFRPNLYVLTKPSLKYQIIIIEIWNQAKQMFRVLYFFFYVCFSLLFKLSSIKHKLCYKHLVLGKYLSWIRFYFLFFIFNLIIQ